MSSPDPAELRHDAVTFSPEGGSGRLALSLRGGWTVTPGLAPDVNAATVKRAELAKLPPSVAGLTGTIEFWGSSRPGEGAPDVALAGVSLVDISPGYAGRAEGEASPATLEYDLSFADFRHAYVEPRGGRLFDGAINPDPPLDPAAPLVSMADAIQRALSAMGGAAALPVGLPSADPPRGLDWGGAHAPSELSRLLQEVGAVFLPQSSGLPLVDYPGGGPLPSLPAEDVAFDELSPLADRRALQVAITSAPAATLDCFTPASSAATWRYVAQDQAGAWVPLVDALAGAYATGAEAVRDGFSKIPEARRERVRKQAYRAVQLDRLGGRPHDPARSPILAEALDAAGVRRPPYFKATLGRPVDRDRWADVAGAEVEPERGRSGPATDFQREDRPRRGRAGAGPGRDVRRGRRVAAQDRLRRRGRGRRRGAGVLRRRLYRGRQRAG